MTQLDFFSEPLARWSDPVPSHEAAWSLVPGSDDLIRRIRECVRVYGPMTAFEIAEHIERLMPGRWDEGTVRSAVSRAELGVAKIKGVSPRGHRCSLYVLRTVETKPL